MPTRRSCLLTVHAHPDDESEFGAPSVARYHHQGVRTVLVCCTEGGSGRISNPEVGRVGDRTNIAQTRREELKVAAAIVGYDEVVMLDYPDSGSVDQEERSPTCFARIPLEGPVRRVVEVIRWERPDVVVTYADDQRVYPHPDHRRAHEVAVLIAGEGELPAERLVRATLVLAQTKSAVVSRCLPKQPGELTRPSVLRQPGPGGSVPPSAGLGLARLVRPLTAAHANEPWPKGVQAAPASRWASSNRTWSSVMQPLRQLVDRTTGDTA